MPVSSGTPLEGRAQNMMRGLSREHDTAAVAGLGYSRSSSAVQWKPVPTKNPSTFEMHNMTSINNNVELIVHRGVYGSCGRMQTHTHTQTDTHTHTHTLLGPFGGEYTPI